MERVVIKEDSQGPTNAKYYYYYGGFVSRLNPEQISENQSDDEESKLENQPQQSGSNSINLKHLWRNKSFSDVIIMIEDELDRYDSESEDPTYYRRDDVGINCNIEN